MAKAAFQCKAFARSLMNFEQQVVTIQERSTGNKDLPAYYEKLHEIYAQLDEPDGMEGVSTLILSPSLEHQIRQHESTGRWTSAQSCWEVRLQESPDNVNFHLGLLRCLRNLGHYGWDLFFLPQRNADIIYQILFVHMQEASSLDTQNGRPSWLISKLKVLGWWVHGMTFKA